MTFTPDNIPGAPKAKDFGTAAAGASTPAATTDPKGATKAPWTTLANPDQSPPLVAGDKAPKFIP